jgi:hypothetical protein
VAKCEVVLCDGCGAQRKDVNHWFVISPPGNFEQFNIGGSDFQGPSLLITHYSDETTNASGVKHFCGQVCVHKFVDEFLSK